MGHRFKGKGGGTKSKRDRRGRNAFVTRRMGRVKKHEFGFVRVNTESNTRKPLPTKGGKMAEFSNNPGKSLTSRKDTTIVHIKGEVGIARATKTKLKERRGKNG